MAAASGTMLFLLISIAVMAVTASEAKIKKRSIELPVDLHLNNPDITVVKRASLFKQSLSEPELVRIKRFKRDAPEPELQRVKRTKRDAEDGELVRVKRTKRTTDEQEPILQRVKRADVDGAKRRKREDGSGERELERKKRYKRAVHLNKFSNKEAVRMKRAGKNKRQSLEAYDFSTLKRSKRAGMAADSVKHVKNTHMREKRRQPLNMEEFGLGKLPHGKMDSVVKKAVEKLKRSKRHPKRGKSTKLHRTKRAGLKGERSEVLKDITRDITRLQRLRRGIAHELIHDVKRQTKAKNHHIITRRDSPKTVRTGMKKHHFKSNK